MESIIKWIENWFASQCDGNWEYVYGVKIYTLDNPGWSVEIDLEGTELADLEMEVQVFGDPAGKDWHSFLVADAVFRAGGDPGKLELLLNLFKELVESNTNKG
ncbi:immunity 53 family protein [Chitinophaga sp. 212800010-3]|uniref:immunity 53 family protein n=1 Tax=unclassified Chitinophaga TaxID=2619133 RepID=UPI002DF5A335|nr:Rhodanese-related sulfurtransferase [Chitinophaga sp. 212800010-3]